MHYNTKRELMGIVILFIMVALLFIGRYVGMHDGYDRGYKDGIENCK